MRKYPDRPFLGVGAVVLDGQGRVLLVKRAHEPLKGEWSLPGGGVEVGETLEAAVAREIREETGLRVDVGGVLDVFERIQRDADARVEFHFVVIDYICYASDDRLSCGSDAQDACWADPGNLDGYRLTDAAVRMIDKGVRLSASTGNTPARRAAR